MSTSFRRFWATQSGAFLGLLTAAFSTYASSYLDRRDINRQAFDQCRSATSGWIAELKLTGEIASAATLSLKIGPTFLFTPLDDEMRNRASTFAPLNGKEIDSILRAEFFYRSMRTDLADLETKGIIPLTHVYACRLKELPADTNSSGAGALQVGQHTDMRQSTYGSMKPTRLINPTRYSSR